MTGDIQRWLGSLGLGKYGEVFAENEIDFGALTYLDEDDLKDLGLPMGPRKNLLAAIAELEKSAPATAGPDIAVREAERRQLTVMFVDMVGSTALSGRLDPEEMREAITAYQNAVAGVVTRFDGHVAKYMGDGVLCYFGWPQAHEDDAERAVRAGLAIMVAIGGIAAPGGEAISARAGIATGLVVVGDLIGEGAAQEQAVVGETPNLAARLQGAAAPGQVVLAEATRRLLGHGFELIDLGPQNLQGIAEPAPAYTVRGERMLESRFAARGGEELAAMIGRDQELALLLDRWGRAKAGEGQMVLLTGEAGIGKSRITQGLIDALADQNHVRVSYQCSPYHTDSSFHPAIQQLTLASGFDARDTPEARLDKLEALLRRAQDDVSIAAPLLGGLLGLGEVAEARHGGLDYSPQQRRARTLEALLNQLTGLAAKTPVLFVLEDAHWVDPTTLELVELTLDRVGDVAVMLLVTARPSFEYGFGGHPIVTRLALNRLGREQTSGIIAQITKGKALPVELMDEIAARTDGVPLFVEELTKTVLESGALRETDDAWVVDGHLDRLAIPSSLHDSLMARLDRLQPVKEVAQMAACIGREFAYHLLSAVSRLDEAELTEALEHLVSAELVFRRGVPPDASYIFKHALVRDAAYESLLKSKRQAIHDRLLAALEESADSAPEILAQHAQEAGLLEKAADYWQLAGQAALARPAYEEAISELGNAIRLARELGESQGQPWIERELELQVQLAQALIPKRGYAAEPTAQVYERAAVLVERIGSTPLRFPVQYGRWVRQYLLGEHAATLPVAQALIPLAETEDDDAARLVAHRITGSTLFSLGRLAEAKEHLDAALSLYRPNEHRELANRFGQEPGIAAHCYLAMVLWVLGYPDQAAAHGREAERAAEALGHVNTACYVGLHLSIIAMCSRDHDVWARNARIMADLAEQHGMLFWVVYADICIGILDAIQGSHAGLERARSGALAFAAGMGSLFSPIFTTEEAKSACALGAFDHCREAIARAREAIDTTDERWAEPELARAEGDLALAEDDRQAAESHYRRAVELAQGLGAKSWELRAAASLARMWHDQGETAEARVLLASVYGWFTEGFKTPDLKEAKALLDGLV